MIPVKDKLVPAKTSDPRKARLPSTVLPLEVDHRIRPMRFPTMEAFSREQEDISQDPGQNLD